MEQLAIKDPDAHHPIATRWRPTLREIVRRFVAGDYALQGVACVEPVSEATAARMRNYVARYGQRLIELPEATWRTSVAQWMEEDWHALIDLWTAESGRSDMVLDLHIDETDNGFRFRIQGIYVP